MEQNSGQSVIGLAKQGDHAAIHQLYLQTRNFAYFIAKRCVQNDADVAKILESSYIEAFHVANIPNEHEFKKLLHGIVSSKSLNLMKKKGIKIPRGEGASSFFDDEEMFERMGSEAAAIPSGMAKAVYSNFSLKLTGGKNVGPVIAAVAIFLVLVLAVAAALYYFGMPMYQGYMPSWATASQALKSAVAQTVAPASQESTPSEAQPAVSEVSSESAPAAPDSQSEPQPEAQTPQMGHGPALVTQQTAPAGGQLPPESSQDSKPRKVTGPIPYLQSDFTYDSTKGYWVSVSGDIFIFSSEFPTGNVTSSKTIQIDWDGAKKEAVRYTLESGDTVDVLKI